MFSKKFMCFLLFVLFLSMTVAFASDGDDAALADETQMGNKTFEKIQTDIDTAQSGDNVSIDNYYFGENEINVKKSINIEGKNNAVLDGRNVTGIMEISADNVNIKNICFKNSNGPAITICANNITIANCTFEDNPGGAIFEGQDMHNIYILGCTFKNNYNPLRIVSGENITIADSSFTASTSSAISIFSRNSIIKDCIFTDNKANEYGCGAISGVPGPIENLTIIDCSFVRNENPIYINGRNISISNSSFTNNSGSAVRLNGLNHRIVDSNFTNNTNFDNNGGAILYDGLSYYMLNRLDYTGDERFIIKNCNFLNNRAYSGGAIYYDGGDFDSIESVPDQAQINVNEGLIDGCNFIGNEATVYSGGAIDYHAFISTNVKTVYYTKVTVSNSTFTRNSAISFGGDVNLGGANNRIINCNFSDGFSDKGGSLNIHASGNYEVNPFTNDNNSVEKCSFKNARSSFGGAMAFIGTKLGINDCTFENCYSRVDCGAIYVNTLFDGLSKAILGEIIINNTKFINNSAGERAGIISTSNSLKIDNCEFINNHAGRIDAAISASTSKMEITNSKFINNTSPAGVIRFTQCEYVLNNNYYLNNGLGTFFIGKSSNYKVLNDQFKEIKLIKISAPKLTTAYKSGKYFKVTLTELVSGKPVAGFRVIIKDKTTGKSFGRTTDSKGIVYLNFLNSKIGKHTIEVTLAENWYNSDKVLSTLEVTKIKTSVKAPKVTYKYKKSKYFKVTVKVGKNPLKKTYVKIKIDKKTYKIKTDNKGIAKVNTKKLKVGKHKVVISSGSSYYTMSGKSTITIKK